MDDGGTITLTGSTADFFFCLIRNVFADSNQSVSSGMIKGYPYFAVIQAYSSADVATKPLGYAVGGDAGDELNYYVNFINANQTIDIYPPYGGEPSTANFPSQSTDGVLHLKGFNFSRLILAKATWDAVSSTWSVTQYTNSDVVMPLSITLNELKVLGSTPSPHTPNNMTEQDAWYGSYSGYDKDFTLSTVRTED